MVLGEVNGFFFLLLSRDKDNVLVDTLELLASSTAAAATARDLSLADSLLSLSRSAMSGSILGVVRLVIPIGVEVVIPSLRELDDGVF